MITKLRAAQIGSDACNNISDSGKIVEDKYTHIVDLVRRNTQDKVAYMEPMVAARDAYKEPSLKLMINGSTSKARAPCPCACFVCPPQGRPLGAHHVALHVDSIDHALWHEGVEAPDQDRQRHDQGLAGQHEEAEDDDGRYGTQRIGLAVGRVRIRLWGTAHRPFRGAGRIWLCKCLVLSVLMARMLVET